MTEPSKTISVSDLTDFCVAALRKCGVSEADARTTTDVLVTTDTFGVYTHGVKCLRGYITRLRAGGLKADAVPRVDREGPAWAIVDGQCALGMVTSVFAMNKAIEKAKTAGMAYVGVRNSCHFGAAGYYATLAAKADMIGMAMANDYPSMAILGAKKAVLGTNPFAYAVPAGKNDPIFLDIASSTVAGGKVRIAQIEEPEDSRHLDGRRRRHSDDRSVPLSRLRFAAALRRSQGLRHRVDDREPRGRADRHRRDVGSEQLDRRPQGHPHESRRGLPGLQRRRDRSRWTPSRTASIN